MIRVVSLNRMEKKNDLRDFTGGMFVVGFQKMLIYGIDGLVRVLWKRKATVM